MKKILYVEDNMDTAEAVKIILRNAGYHIEIVGSGNECLKVADQGFDLFLLDIMLPDMSGWDIFENLKKMKIVSKFVFLSAIPITSDRMNELKNSGITDYITKPFTKIDLLKRIERVLEIKQ